MGAARTPSGNMCVCGCKCLQGALHAVHLQPRSFTPQASCISGCSCDPIPLNGTIPHLFATQEHLDLLLVTPSPECVLRVRTTGRTDSNGCGGGWSQGCPVVDLSGLRPNSVLAWR